MRSIKRWIVLAAGGVLMVLAANGGRIYDGLSRLLAPASVPIIIVAPTGSELV